MIVRENNWGCLNREQMFVQEGSKTIFGRIYDIEDLDADGLKRIKVSLMTSKMLKLDLNLMRESDQTTDYEKYKPYFYEYICDTSDPVILEKASEIKNEGDKKGKIPKYGWRRVYFHRDDKYDDIEFTLKDGVHFTSMSPLQRKGRSLHFCKDGVGISEEDLELLQKYENDYRGIIKGFSSSKSGSVTIPNISLISGVNDGIVYSVGMGNNIQINLKTSGNTKFVIWFDLGVSLSKKDLSDPVVAANLRTFKTKKMNAIILSHWDLDHIIAVGNFDDNEIYGKEIVWIAPDLNLLIDHTGAHVSNSAIRLFIYLYYVLKGRFIIYNKCGKLCYSFKGLEIYQGDGSTKCASIANNIGLILKIDDYLFCGDCSYEAMPGQIKTSNYSFVVGAHHGSDKTTPDINGKRGSRVVFSVGHDTNYPSRLQVNRFKKQGFMVENTRDNTNPTF